MAHPVLHFEVSGKDLDKLNSFYSELFGWKTQKVPGDMPYAMVEKEEENAEVNQDRPEGEDDTMDTDCTPNVTPTSSNE